MRRPYKKMARRYEQGLQHGWQDCAQLLHSRGVIDAATYACVMQATSRFVSPETKSTVRQSFWRGFRKGAIEGAVIGLAMIAAVLTVWTIWWFTQ